MRPRRPSGAVTADSSGPPCNPTHLVHVDQPAHALLALVAPTLEPLKTELRVNLIPYPDLLEPLGRGTAIVLPHWRRAVYAICDSSTSSGAAVPFLARKARVSSGSTAERWPAALVGRHGDETGSRSSSHKRITGKPRERERESGRGKEEGYNR